MSGESDYADPNDRALDEELEAVLASAANEPVEEFDAAPAEVDLSTAIAQRDEYLDSLRRLQAEFDNYRKRVLRQQTDLLERSTESLLVRLLPVLDTLDLALSHEAESDKDSSPVLSQIAALFRDTLIKEGLERIDETGAAFDPTIHDTVAQAERDDDEPSEDDHGHEVRVIEVLRAGYQLKGKVLRPAMVKVEA